MIDFCCPKLISSVNKINLITNAGKRSVAVPNSPANFVKLGGDRILLIDFDGNRYEITSVAALDRKSRKYLEVVI